MAVSKTSKSSTARKPTSKKVIEHTVDAPTKEKIEDAEKEIVITQEDTCSCCFLCKGKN